MSDYYEVRRANENRWGKKRLGTTTDFGGSIPNAEPGYSIWVESGTVYTAPIVDKTKFGGHAYDNGGYESGIRDCKCGTFMLSSSSGGPVDPFGACPLNPQAEKRVVYGFSVHGFVIRVMNGAEKIREVSVWQKTEFPLDLLEQHVRAAVTELAEEYKIDYNWREPEKHNTLVRDNSILDRRVY